jgi:hypothetical protein
VIDVDNEGFLFVAEEYGAAVGGGHDALDGDGDDVWFHEKREPAAAEEKRKPQGGVIRNQEG